MVTIRGVWWALGNVAAFELIFARSEKLALAWKLDKTHHRTHGVRELGKSIEATRNIMGF